MIHDYFLDEGKPRKNGGPNDSGDEIEEIIGKQETKPVEAGEAIGCIEQNKSKMAAFFKSKMVAMNFW